MQGWTGTAACVVTGLALGMGAGPAAAARAARQVRVYVGTYTGGESKGIYRFLLDETTGALVAAALSSTCSTSSTRP